MFFAKNKKNERNIKMHKILRQDKRAGFTVIEVLLVATVIAIVGGLVYVYFQHQSTTTSNNTSPISGISQAVVAPAGTTTSVAQLTAQYAQTEANVDKSADSQILQNATSANSAASNVGGAYDASSF
jgi:prepilin-type N-terminal cleavage/methylation domain-containing protein